MKLFRHFLKLFLETKSVKSANLLLSSFKAINLTEKYLRIIESYAFILQIFVSSEVELTHKISKVQFKKNYKKN